MERLKAIKCSSLLHQHLTCDELGPANSDLSDVFYGPYSLQLVNYMSNLKNEKFLHYSLLVLLGQRGHTGKEASVQFLISSSL